MAWSTMSHHSKPWAVGVLLGLLSYGSMAVAADPAAEQAARAAFAEGNQLYEAGNYVGALDKFREAYTQMESPKILLNLGTTLRQLGRFTEAATTYERYIAHPKADPARKAEAMLSLKEVLEKIGTLQIEVDPPGGRVMVDGREAGRSDSMVKVRVDAGSHVVVADDGSGWPVTISVNVSAGESQNVRIKMKENPTNLNKEEASASEIKKHESIPKPDNTGRGEGRKTIGYVLGSVGVVGLGVGVATYFVLGSKKSTMDSARCEPTTKICSGANLNDANGAAGTKAASSGNSLQPLFYGGLALGAVGLAAGTYFLFSTDNTSRVALSVGLKSAVVQGSF